MKDMRMAAWGVSVVAAAEVVWAISALMKVPDRLWRDMHFPITTFMAAPLLALVASVVAAREDMAPVKRFAVAALALVVVGASMKWFATLRVLW